MATVQDFDETPENTNTEPVVKTLPANFTMEGDYTASLPEAFTDDRESIVMPSDHNTEIKERLSKVSGKTKDFNSKWLSTFQASLESVAYNEAFIDTVNRKDADFRQKIESSVGPLFMGMAKPKVDPNKKLTGENLRLMIRQELNLGGTYNIPLWHSGFWVRFKAPSESAILDLYRALTEEKVSLGRATYGLVFSNNTSYTSSAMLSFCEDHTIYTSLIVPENESIKKYISVLDIPILFWGMVCSIWPTGFQYQRACTAEPEKCNHVVEDLLDPSKLLWVDKSKLTARQIAHMAKREKGSITVEALKIYKDEFLNGQPKAIKYSENVSFVIAIDSAQEHIDSGYRWISSIEETYPSVMIQDEKSRDEYLIRQAKTTIMRQYAHFVKSVTYMDNEYTDRNDIEEIIGDISGNDGLRKVFQDEVKKFIDDSTVALIAIPTYKCPSCGKEQRTEKEGQFLQGLIPLEVMSNFFTLVVQKIRRINQR